MEGFSEDQFDLVFSNESLHHWIDPRKAFLEIQRVLKPEGKLLARADGSQNNCGTFSKSCNERRKKQVKRETEKY